MTTDDAYAIQLYLAELEFPKIFSTSVFFALFKTYGIPSISSLLVHTNQLSSLTTASKRAADTGVILTEVVLNAPTSTRTTTGIARMNYLHDGYRKQGKILDSDMLYTLSLFALEPSRWTNKYEWRQLTDMELCAIGTFWKSLGDAMEIPYDALPSSEAGWTDGLQWLDELKEWSLEYEKEKMIPAESNKQLAASTIDILMVNVPKKLRGIAKNFVSAILEDRLRTSMMLDDPPLGYSFTLNGILHLRKLFIRYLSLPRPSFLRVRFINDAPNPQTGRYHSPRYVAHPWYVKPSFMGRWGFEAWVTRVLGGTLPGNEGKKYIPEGYHLSNLGPKTLEGKGVQKMEETRKKLETQERGGCPFAALKR